VEENRAFAEKFDFPYPLLCDTGREIGLAYGACDDAGAGAPRRISYLIAPDQTIARAYPKVSAKQHPADVLEHLAALAGA
jgi:thioredoxin-dependent peroxiredoxin